MIHNTSRVVYDFELLLFQIEESILQRMWQILDLSIKGFASYRSSVVTSFCMAVQHKSKIKYLYLNKNLETDNTLITLCATNTTTTTRPHAIMSLGDLLPRSNTSAVYKHNRPF
jgi:hypothetical protein